MRATALDITAELRALDPGPGRANAAVRRVRALATALGITLALLAAVQLLAPGSANAITIPNPLSPITSGLGSLIGGGVGGLSAKIAVKGFVAILNSLFSGFEAHITLQILTWLTSSDSQTGGHVAVLYGLTSGIAIGLLGAVLTASFVRYWLAGLSVSGRGGFEALEGLMRTLGAVAGLLCWPFVFGQLVSLGNICSATILGSPSLRGDIAHLINAVVFVTFKPGGVLGLFVSVVLAVVGAVLFLGLLFMKVMTGATLTFLYVAMPIAIILWPVEELAWLARHAARTFMCLVLIPVVWALLFAAFAAMSLNALEFQGAHGFVNQVTQPLVSIVMLWLTVTIPRTLFKMATSGIGLGRHGGGFLSHAGSYLAARQAGAFLQERGLLPAGPGGFLSGGGAEAEPNVMPNATGPTDGVWMSTRDLARESEDGEGGESQPGAANVGAFVQEMAAGAAGPAAGGAEAAEAISLAAADATEGGDELTSERSAHALTQERPSAPGEPEQVAETEPVENSGTTASGAPVGEELAAGPSIGKYRPERDHPNPLAARPADSDKYRPALEAAMSQVRTWPPPDPAAAHTAFRKLGPDVQARMHQQYDSGGGENANAVKLEAAWLSTSDQISNAQAADLMTVARAAEHDQIHWLLGRDAPERAAAPPPAPAVSPAGPVSAATSAPSAPATSEPSPHAAERDEAWRKAGPSVQPHTD